MAHAQALSIDARLPLYLQLREDFLSRIASGQWRPDDAIPAEEELAARHGVALGTVRKAIEGLVSEGLLERRQGKGTFVRRARLGNALARFFRMTDESGRPISPQARLLSRDIQAANAETAERLGLAVGTPAIALTRLRLVAGNPILAEQIMLPHALFQPLADMAFADFGDLLYPLYERACGQVVASARETIRFGALPQAFAAALETAPGSPVAIIERTAFGFDGTALEFRRSYGPADRFSYSIDIR